MKYAALAAVDLYQFFKVGDGLLQVGLFVGRQEDEVKFGGKRKWQRLSEKWGIIRVTLNVGLTYYQVPTLRLKWETSFLAQGHVFK